MRECEPARASCARAAFQARLERAARRRAGGLRRRGGREARGARAPLRALSRRITWPRTASVPRFPRLPARGRRVAARACAVRGAAGALPCRGSQRLGLAGVARSLARPGIAAVQRFVHDADRARRATTNTCNGRPSGSSRACRRTARRSGCRWACTWTSRSRWTAAARTPGRSRHATRSMPASARRPTTSTARARTGACRRCGPTACATPATRLHRDAARQHARTPARCASTT